MRRRKIIAGVGCAAVSWPFALRSQQPLPVVGFLNGGDAAGYAPNLAAFIKGLSEAGYVVGRNVNIEYRWAEGRNERLPSLAAELAQRTLAVIAATSTPAALAARALNTTIPIVFETAADPVALGLVASLNRPGGTITGVAQLSVEIAPKRLELLHELFPENRAVVVLVNPNNPVVAEVTENEARAAAGTFGMVLHVVKAGSDADLDATIAKVSELHASGVLISGGDPLFVSRSAQLASLAIKYAVPMVGGSRGFVRAGGLMSYGSDITDSYRLTGTYVGRVLKGEKPADLPIEQPTKFDLVVNLKTAKLLGIAIPPTVLARADEVIE